MYENRPIPTKRHHLFANQIIQKRIETYEDEQAPSIGNSKSLKSLVQLPSLIQRAEIQKAMGKVPPNLNSQLIHNYLQGKPPHRLTKRLISRKKQKIRLDLSPELIYSNGLYREEGSGKLYSLKERRNGRV